MTPEKAFAWMEYMGLTIYLESGVDGPQWTVVAGGPRGGPATWNIRRRWEWESRGTGETLMSAMDNLIVTLIANGTLPEVEKRDGDPLPEVALPSRGVDLPEEYAPPIFAPQPDPDPPPFGRRERQAFFVPRNVQL